MQFHFDGFVAGDPDLSPARQMALPDDHARTILPSHLDVLIIGSGPAGLTLAAQLAAFPDIETCIVEQKAGLIQLGQADGVACRTMEMFNAFGFAERVLREAYWVNETCFWTSSTGRPDAIVRSGRVPDTEPGLSEFPHVILNQARVHEFYLDVMGKSACRMKPAYGVRLIDLDIARPTDRGDIHPVTARFERIDAPGEIRAVKARYVVGCDGARSAVRRSIGQTLKGDAANQAWGVMDVLAVTDFPDIRLKAIINAAEGSMVLIPREGGYLVRFYVEMDELAADERVAEKGIDIDHIVAAAQRMLAPYTLDVKEVAWWSVYEIGQRVSDRFDDLGDRPTDRLPRAFIAGDACHTHSPKAGQGMNVSMQDAFNLGWKLASVLRGHSKPELLLTYNDERQAVAKELIAFDREWASILSAPLKSDANPDGIDPARVADYFLRSGRYTAGVATRYPTSPIVGPPTYQHLATAFIIGSRFHSANVVRLADARRVQLGHVAQADGRWRLYVFAGNEDPYGDTSDIGALGAFLSQSRLGGPAPSASAPCDVDAAIDVRVVFQQAHRDMALERLPAFLFPTRGKLGLRDYEKVFCSDQAGDDIYRERGIDRAGCMVLVRPDQFVAHVLPLNAHGALAEFFSAFSVEHAVVPA